MNEIRLNGYKQSRTMYLDHLSKLTGTNLIFSEQDKIDHFKDFLKSLSVKEDVKTYPDWVFFFNDDVCYMELRKNTGDLYCSYRYIWSVYEKEYSMQYNDIQSFIKHTVEEHFRTQPVTPNTGKAFSDWVEEHFRTQPVTPKMIPRRFLTVEEHFRTQPVTPKRVKSTTKK